MEAEKQITEAEKQVVVLKKFEDLILSGKRLQKKESETKVRKAFNFAREKHNGQYRKTGLKLPFIVHPVAVAKIIVTEMGFGSSMATAALLHDVVEDTEVTIEDIENLFDKETARVVDGVTKIKKVSEKSRLSEQAENFKEFILKMSVDKRIAYLKIADRLHNLRTMAGIYENSQMIKTAEALHVYAPIAALLGLHDIKNELQDLSFMYRHPTEYKMIEKQMLLSKKTRKSRTSLIYTPISEALKEHGYKFNIKPVKKSLYEVWRITTKKNITFDEVDSYVSLRITFEAQGDLPEKQQCYLLYALITDLFKVRENNLQDYISTPKSNGFEGLINDVIIKGRWVEVQILTERMNQIALRGYAKNHENNHIKEIDKWIRSLGQEIKLEGDELTEEYIFEKFYQTGNQIQVFTDSGEAVKLPAGSTVLDFAFHLHSELGLNFKYATINGDKNVVDYNYVLNFGDFIKIFKSETPLLEKEWYDSSKTGKARTYLRKYFNKIEQEFIEEGKLKLSEILFGYEIPDNLYSIMYKKFNCDTKNKLYLEIQKNEITTDEIKALLKPPAFFGQILNLIPGNISLLNQNNKKQENTGIHNFNHKLPFPVREHENFIFSTCCNPIPGDNAIIYFNSKDQPEIHKKKCDIASEANAGNGKRTAVVKWEGDSDTLFPVKVHFEGADRHGLISEISQIISSEMKINMTNLSFSVSGNIFKGEIVLLVRNKAGIAGLIKRIKNIKEIVKVTRN